MLSFPWWLNISNYSDIICIGTEDGHIILILPNNKIYKIQNFSGKVKGICFNDKDTGIISCAYYEVISQQI